MYSEAQCSTAKEVVRYGGTSIWHINATGSLITKSAKSESPIYLYAVVMPVKIVGEPCLPLVEWLSNSHNTVNISSTLFSWWIRVKELVRMPETIVTYCSWALMHSVASVFNRITLDRQLDRQWEMFSKGDVNQEFVSLRLCAAHYLKSISRRLARMGYSKQVLLLSGFNVNDKIIQ